MVDEMGEPDMLFPWSRAAKPASLNASCNFRRSFDAGLALSSQAALSGEDGNIFCHATKKGLWCMCIIGLEMGNFLPCRRELALSLD